MKIFPFLFLILSIHGITEQILYQFKGDEKVIDLMCSEGDRSLKLAKLVRKGAVVAVDVSFQAIDIAKTKHLQAPSHLSFKHKNFDDLKFYEKFDVVTALNFENLALEPSFLIRKGNELLREKGFLDCIFLKKIPFALRVAFKTIASTEKWNPYLIGFEPNWYQLKEESINDVLNSNHLNLIEKKIDSDECIFATDGEFKAFLKRWIPFESAIPEKSHQEFLQDFIERYLVIFPKDKQGNIHLLIEKYEFLAQKLEDK